MKQGKKEQLIRQVSGAYDIRGKAEQPISCAGGDHESLGNSWLIPIS